MEKSEEQKIMLMISRLSYIQGRVEGLDIGLRMNNITFPGLDSVLDISKLIEIEIEKLKTLIYGEPSDDFIKPVFNIKKGVFFNTNGRKF
jgi:hypothetical protein